MQSVQNGSRCTSFQGATNNLKLDRTPIQYLSCALREAVPVPLELRRARRDCHVVGVDDAQLQDARVVRAQPLRRQQPHPGAVAKALRGEKVEAKDY